jgi:predicted DNA-binding transcriptional regulator YafY
MHFSEHSRRQVVAAWDEGVGAPRNFLMTNIVRYSFPGRTFTRKFVVA